MTQISSGPTTVSSARRRFSLFALAIGGFGIGAGEFTAMGLLPQIAQDLTPELAAAASEQANAHSGLIITAYAIGVVVGAPTLGVMLGRFPRKATILALLAALSLGSFLSAALPSFELVFASRVLAGLPHGAYFGLAALAAADLMGPGKRGQGAALVLVGLTISNMAGVPLFTAIGQQSGWRAAYYIVALIFVAALVAVALALPRSPGNPQSTIRGELRAFRLPQVWFALGMAAIGFGGLFAVYTYIAPMVTDVAGQEASLVPVVLVIMGAGMTLGNLLGGWYVDRDIRGAIYASFALMIVGLLALWSTMSWIVPTIVSLFIVGAAASALSPSIQVRLMHVARGSTTVAAVTNHASLNIGNALGAYLGSVGVGLHFGYRAPVWIGLAMTVVGLVIAVVAFSIERRDIRRGLITETGSLRVVTGSLPIAG